MSSQRVQLDIQDHHVVMDNGILQVTLSKPDGIVTRIQYNGIDNLLEVLNEEVNRGYWDLVWSEAGSVGTTGTFDVIKGTEFEVIVESDEQVEVSFTRKWNPSQKGKLVPLNIDKRFIMLRNSSGFYSYAIYDHLKEWPPFNLPQTRIVFKLRKEKFQYMAIADNRQRYMPLPDDRSQERSKVLDVPEAVLLVNPIEPEFKGEVVMDNGILQVTLSKPDGIVTRIQYNGIDNLLEVLSDEVDRGYWDLVWSEAGSVGTTGTFDVIKGTKFEVIVESDEQVEVSFTRKWNPSQKGKLVPLNIDKRFIMLRNSSGFYSYAIYDHLKEWPPFNLPQTRIVFKLRKEKFQYMAIADNRQRYMPLPDDRSQERSKVLDVPEAVLLVNPIEPEFKGEVDDKYEYSSENQNLRIHGWICMDPPVGFWQITPSDEFRSGGPLKQNLTSHVGPYCLAMFLSAHYSGEDLVLKLKPDEPWKKVFGPVFIYLNSATSNANDDPSPLWEDAKHQMMTEVQKWPYDFPASSEFPPSDQRGNVSGRIQVRDRYVSEDCIPGKGAYVGLAPPGDAGSFQRDCKGYQFWTRADEHGYYSIKNIREGQYNLYAWVPGFIGDYRYDAAINITAGCDSDVGELVYEPPRDGPTLWEIGIPDRSAAEFYVPDPNPNYINKLYVNHPDRFRQYGLWERYADLYPDQDLIYTVGTSDYAKDWFFAQVTRKKDDDTYEGTTWQIKFQLDNVNKSGTFKLRISLATANIAELQIRINDPKADPPLFTTGVIGKDNTILRHGIHGLYWLYSIDIPATLLVEGNNTLFLTQPISDSPLPAFHGLMYDYIRLEGPPSSTSTRGVKPANIAPNTSLD
ncbi:probable rhamnogalacturonate lyase B isoform X2 [Prunus avium]|uniref:rhamnogalacturonan endolyase n=1 Tax=Prunus avium TaxID=42229 RepID=A0A6P5TYR1_PRUAV|nr:probable rhamnogalacturonate lyase B isoform X2 [Prunus avium]